MNEWVTLLTVARSCGRTLWSHVAFFFLFGFCTSTYCSVRMLTLFKTAFQFDDLPECCFCNGSVICCTRVILCLLVRMFSLSDSVHENCAKSDQKKRPAMILFLWKQMFLFLWKHMILFLWTIGPWLQQRKASISSAFRHCELTKF